jgi:hypothetical protein
LPTVVVPVDPNPPTNHAVNNDGDYDPRLSASHAGGDGRRHSSGEA